MTEKVQRKVLIIDNDRIASDMIVKTLLPRGLDVSVAANPDRGFEKALELKPDLVFISLFFSDYNGLKISRRIHSEEDLKKVPMIMLISYRGELDPRYTSSIGIVDVLVKPLKPEDIVAKTKKVLGEEAVTEEITGDDAISAKGEEKVIPAGEEGAVDIRTAVSVSLPEGGTLQPADLPQDHGRNEAKKESLQTLDGTEEFLRGESEEGRRRPEEIRLHPATKGEEQSALVDAYGDEILPSEEPRQFISGRKVLAFTAVLAVVLLVIGAYGLKKIVLRTQKVAPAKVAADGGEKKAAALGAAARHEVPATNEPTKVVPEGKAAAASGKEYGFTVQVGAFGSEKNAALLVEKMKEKGFDAFIEKDPLKPLYRVLVGRFGDQKRASQEAKLLREEGLRPVVRTGRG
jgi:CheY-like chemotaxis protein